MRSLQVDDAGFSCLLGGGLLGCYNPETGAVDMEVVPVELFQDETPNKRRFYVEDTILSLVRKHLLPGQRILLCRGPLFNDAAKALRLEGYVVHRGIIVGRLQNALKQAHLDYLAFLGFPLPFREGKQKEPVLDEMVRWIFDRVGDREPLAKTGYGCWQAATLQYQRA